MSEDILRTTKLQETVTKGSGEVKDCTEG